MQSLKFVRNFFPTQVFNHRGHRGLEIIHYSVIPPRLILPFVVTWIGNNDVFRTQYDLNSQLTTLFDWQESVYNAGARNFVFINVVPYDRSPAAGNSWTRLCFPNNRKFHSVIGFSNFGMEHRVTSICQWVFKQPS